MFVSLDSQEVSILPWITQNLQNTRSAPEQGEQCDHQGQRHSRSLEIIGMEMLPDSPKRKRARENQAVVDSHEDKRDTILGFQARRILGRVDQKLQSRFSFRNTFESKSSVWNLIAVMKPGKPAARPTSSKSEIEFMRCDWWVLC